MSSSYVPGIMECWRFRGVENKYSMCLHATFDLIFFSSGKDFRVWGKKEVYWFHVGELHLRTFYCMCELNVKFWGYWHFQSILHGWYKKERNVTEPQQNIFSFLIKAICLFQQTSLWLNYVLSLFHFQMIISMFILCTLTILKVEINQISLFWIGW